MSPSPCSFSHLWLSLSLYSLSPIQSSIPTIPSLYFHSHAPTFLPSSLSPTSVFYSCWCSPYSHSRSHCRSPSLSLTFLVFLLSLSLTSIPLFLSLTFNHFFLLAFPFVSHSHIHALYSHSTDLLFSSSRWPSRVSHSIFRFPLTFSPHFLWVLLSFFYSLTRILFKFPLSLSLFSSVRYSFAISLSFALFILFSYLHYSHHPYLIHTYTGGILNAVEKCLTCVPRHSPITPVIKIVKAWPTNGRCQVGYKQTLALKLH